MTYSYTEKNASGKVLPNAPACLTCLSCWRRNSTLILPFCRRPSLRRVVEIRACRRRSVRFFRFPALVAMPASEFVSYQLAEPTFDVNRNVSSGPDIYRRLRAKVRLMIMDREAPDTSRK